MEQLTLQKRIARTWKGFAERYVSISFAWKSIVYGTMFFACVLIGLAYLYYSWAITEASGVKSVRQIKAGITEKEVNAVNDRIDRMNLEYENSKSERFDIPEPVSYKAKTVVATTTLSGTTTTPR